MFHVERFHRLVPYLPVLSIVGLLRATSALSVGLRLPILPGAVALSLLTPLLVLHFGAHDQEQKQAIRDLERTRPQSRIAMESFEIGRRILVGWGGAMIILLPTAGLSGFLQGWIEALLFLALAITLYQGVSNRTGSPEVALIAALLLLWLGPFGIGVAGNSLGQPSTASGAPQASAVAFVQILLIWLIILVGTLPGPRS